VLNDTVGGMLGDIVVESTLADCLTSKLERALRNKVKERAKTWGVRVRDVQLADRAVIPSYRLIVDGKDGAL
jgi:hypothetical protein